MLGLLYAIIALGFMLILGTMEVINFSHGVLFALGGYAALALGPHLGWWGALVLAPVIVGGRGALVGSFENSAMYFLAATFNWKL